MKYLFAVGADNEVTIVDTLTEQDREVITKARSALRQFQAGEDLFEIYSVNIQAFYDFAGSTLDSFSRDQGMSSARMQRHVTRANCHLLNVLTSLRTFLDHAETGLKRRHGKASETVAAFQEATTWEYDHHFAYRFFYKLRNYAQHCGLPIANIKLRSEAIGDVGPSLDPPTREAFAMYLAPKHLLDDFDGWGPQVRDELGRMRRPLDVAALLRKHVSSVCAFHECAQLAGFRKAISCLKSPQSSVNPT